MSTDCTCVSLNFPGFEFDIRVSKVAVVLFRAAISHGLAAQIHVALGCQWADFLVDHSGGLRHKYQAPERHDTE